MRLVGDARRAHLAVIQKTLRNDLSRLTVRMGRGLSYCEVYGEMLAALEYLAAEPADEIRFRASVCREEYCKPDGGNYSAIEASLKTGRKALSGEPSP